MKVYQEELLSELEVAVTQCHILSKVKIAVIQCHRVMLEKVVVGCYEAEYIAEKY